MKINGLNKHLAGALILILCATLDLHAQGFGGGRGGGGGFGGFGGGGGGGGGGARGGAGNAYYNNNGTVGGAVIQVDPVTHNLVVIADKVTNEQLRQVIDSLDAPEPQVLIKVVFLEVTHNNALDVGVQGSYSGANNKYSSILGYVTNFNVQNIISGVGSNASSTPTVVPSSITPLKQTLNVNNGFGLPQIPSGATGNGGLYSFMGSDFTATLQAIATAGKAQVLSRPSILARDGQLAEIVVGQSIYLPSGVTFSAIAGSTTTIPTISGTYQNVGIQLDVTPFIGANNLVQMILQPQIESIDTSTPGQTIVGGSIFSGAISAPNINKRSANTVVITPDGQTVGIGGLISNEKSVSDSKIPILGDIPLLGQLFKFSAKADQKTELLMFLTPHIVKAPSQLAGLTAKETGQAPLITKSISEEELDRFLERVPVKKKP